MAGGLEIGRLEVTVCMCSSFSFWFWFFLAKGKWLDDGMRLGKIGSEGPLLTEDLLAEALDFGHFG